MPTPSPYSRALPAIGLLLLALLCTAATCSVNLANTSIPPNVNTYYVKPFGNLASNAPPDIGNDFSERLKNQIRQQSRLDYTDVNPDLEFEGRVKRYVVTSVAPTSDEQVELGRLRIEVEVDYYDTAEEDNNWTKTFSFEQDYPADQNLLDIQDELIGNIFEQIALDVFNEAFGKW